MKSTAFLQYGVSLAPGGLTTSQVSGHARSRINVKFSIPSLAPAVITGLSWTTRTPPPQVAYRRKKCAVLWLRIGHLRLADNPAVAAVASLDGALLPVVTIQQGEVTFASVSAIASLKSSLQALGSTLIVRVVRDLLELELNAVREVARATRARRIFVNNAPNLDCRHFAKSRIDGLCVITLPSMLTLSHENQSDFLHEAPLSLPRVPDRTFRISSGLRLDGSGQKGEAAARARLAGLLDFQGSHGSKGVLFSSLLSSLSEELYLGCLSQARILHEFNCRCSMNLRTKRLQPSQAMKTFFANFRRNPTLAALSIGAYDVNGGDRRGVEWDGEARSFRLKEWEHAETERRMNPQERWQEFWRRRRLFFTRSFFPDDVTPDYYSFTAWRFAQRCVSATIGVFGTSSLLFALGIRSGRIGQAAVISWVLKDGLGRVGKMIWAGSMGKDFDVDPKRWRFRSALLYALGNGLEIVTQIFPASFLVFATAANSMKQVSMLTSSATRNAMYRSFGDRSQNIANITAKGEAQIVVADLIGMGCGIRLSKLLGSSKQNILGTYLALTVLDIFGIYMELRQVVFRSLNAERSNILVNYYVRRGKLLSPSVVSPKERIFLKPRYEGQIRLSSIAKAAKDPEELELLLKVFRREHFLVSTPRAGPGSPCRLVLRQNASNEDVLRAILMIGYVHKHMRNRNRKDVMTVEEQESILRSSWKSANRNFQPFLQASREAGWSTENLLFSTMKRRGYWGRDRS